MTCTTCGETPKNTSKGFTKAVVEINNPEQIVLFRKVIIPASMGGRDVLPPAVGKYHNVLLEYEADGGLFLYSSDGIPTQLSTDVTDLQHQLDALGIEIDDERTERVAADEELSDAIEGEVTNRQAADTALGNRITNLDNSLATVAKTGSYNDLSNKPTIGNATLTIKKNGSNVGTFTANATVNKNINISVPTKTSDLTNDGSDGSYPYLDTRDLPTVDTVYSSTSNNAIANSTVTRSLNRDVMTNLSLDTNPSTTTVNLKNTKTNLTNPSSSTTTALPLPVASSTQAGVMNSATFDAVTNNTNNINAILNGAVAITGLPASPTQAQLTSAWQSETGLTTLINRASIYDTTNQKVWTYYTNDQTWHVASNTTQVTVSTFTNTSEGVIKGSTNNGQVFAENDGTGSVNGWDALTNDVANNASKLATIEQGAEVNVQANWAQTDTNADDYIKNKPTIPTVNNATLTIQKNGTTVETFTANSSTNKTANISVPTAVSELTNDADYATNAALNAGLATKQNTLTAGDNITITGDTISATDTTYTAGNAITIEGNTIKADVYPEDYFTNENSTSNVMGSNITLNNAIESSITDVTLKGNTEQQTYSGKNLIDPTNLSFVYSNSPTQIVLSSISNGIRMVNNGGASQSRFAVFRSVDLTPYAGKVVRMKATFGTSGGIRLYRIASDGSNRSQMATTTVSDTEISFTVPADLGASPYLGYVLDVTAGGGTTVDFTNLIATVDSGIEPYEPYVGGISAPNPDYPQEIHTVTGEQTVEITGKNLFNKSTVALGKNWNGGDGTVCYPYQTQATRAVILVPVKSNTTYNLSLSESQWYVMQVLEADSSYTVLKGDSGQFNQGIKEIVTLANTAYIGIKFKYGSAGTTTMVESLLAELNLQVEQGSATAYEPFQSQTYTIDLGSTELCKIGDYQDYIYKSGEDWYIHKAIGKYTFSGDETFNYQSSHGGFTVGNNIIGNYMPNANIPMVGASDHFVVETTTTTWSGEGKIGFSSVGTFWAKSTAFGNDQASCQTWLQTNTPTVYYAFATPTDTKITDATLVGQLDALSRATSYRDTTNILVTATGDNLPILFNANINLKTLNGTLDAIAKKQDILTAGDGISISNNEVSVDNTIQRRLVAGQNISIHDNVISATGSGSGDNPLTISIVSGSGGGFEWETDDWSVQFIEDIAHSYWGGRTILIEPDPVVASESYSILQPYAIELNYTTPSTLCLRVAYNREDGSLADLVFELDNNYAATTAVRGRTSVRLTTTDPGEGAPLPQDTLLGVYE